LYELLLHVLFLTSYVGFGGLTTRMGGDRCLPSIFQKSDKVATLLFMTICVSLVLILEGDSEALSACYSFAFLTVMALFALSLFILQLQRPKLPRAMNNNPFIPAIACVLVVIALGGAIQSNTSTIPVFAAYLFVLLTCMVLFTFRLAFMKVLIKFLELCKCFPQCIIDRLAARIKGIQQDSSVIFFAKTANISRLNKAIQYMRANEDANHCRVVHVYEDEGSIPSQLLQCCHILDTIYPAIRIDVVLVRGTFGPETIMKLQHEWKVPPNLMFMTCPTSEVKGKRIQDLHGVRVIMSHEEDTLIEKYGSNAHSLMDESLVISNLLAASPSRRHRAYSENTALKAFRQAKAPTDPEAMPAGRATGGRQGAIPLIAASYS